MVIGPGIFRTRYGRSWLLSWEVDLEVASVNLTLLQLQTTNDLTLPHVRRYPWGARVHLLSWGAGGGVLPEPMDRSTLCASVMWSHVRPRAEAPRATERPTDQVDRMDLVDRPFSDHRRAFGSPWVVRTARDVTQNSVTYCGAVDPHWEREP